LRQRLLGVLKPLLLTGVLASLLIMQPDFGGAALILAIALTMLWLAGASLSRLALLALVALPVLLWVAIAESYRLQRLLSFVDPWKDPYADGFQLTQALIAVGRGEWFGVGLGESVQKLFYLPEAHTDFIVAVIAEELGFFGLAGLLALFVLLCGRAYALGQQALDRRLYFHAYLAYGIASWFAVQAVISIGVNLGVLPTKGLTLPFVSSGGSSALMSVAALGILLRVSNDVRSRDAQPSTAGQVEAIAPQSARGWT
jgi:cell division protein FtsW